MTETKKLKIGLEVSSLINHGQDIGAGRYILNLIKGLLAVDCENSYLLFGTYDSGQYLGIAYGLREEFRDSAIGFKFIRAGQNFIKIQEKLGFPPIELFGFRADVFHCMDYLIPPTLNKNIVLTIHDLAFMRFPEFNFDCFIKKYSRLVLKNTNTAKKVLASSASTGRDIKKFFGTSPDKVEVVHLASQPIFRKLDQDSIDKNILAKYGIDRQYLLSVGTIEPRKNYITLIKAYNKARSSDPGFDHKLVIAGRTGWKSEATYSEFELSPYKDDIIFTGRVTDRDLVQIYNQAGFFTYTSLFEGFGFPPLEAMSCGLPVICSESSSMKEVVGDAGILMDPEDINGFRDSILEVARNQKLKEELALKSLSRAKKFSWENTARETLEVYRKAAE